MNINFFPRSNLFSWRHMAKLGNYIEDIRQDLPDRALYCTYPQGKEGIEIIVKSQITPRKELGIQFEIDASSDDIRNCIRYISRSLQEGNESEFLKELIKNSFIQGFNLHSITGLNFQGWSLTGQVRDYCEIIFLDNLFPSLKILNLSFSSLNNEDAFALSCYLPAQTILQALNLHGNSITCIGAGAISSMLNLNDSLNQLDLRGNCIGKDEVKRMKKIWFKRTGNRFSLQLDTNKSITDKKDHYQNILH